MRKLKQRRETRPFVWTFTSTTEVSESSLGITRLIYSCCKSEPSAFPAESKAKRVQCKKKVQVEK